MWCDIQIIVGDCKWAKYPWQHWDSTWKEKLMDAMRTQCLEWGKYQSNAFLASNILDLFKEVEGISYAYGMGASCEVAPISTL